MLTQKSANKVYMALVLAGATALPAIPAQASLLEEVIVTAQKRAQNVNDVGMTISAFQADDLEKLGVVNTADIAAITPGFTYAPSRQGTPIYQIRGVGFNTENVSSTSPVGVYIDEVAYAYPAMSTGLMFDMERVEVLKGPQGTLYGRNTTGGLVNFITKRPTEEFEGSVQLQYGEFETFGLEGVVSGPLGDAVRGRIAFKGLQSNEGWQERLSGPEELGEKDTMGVRGSLEFDLSDTVSATLTVSHWTDESDTQAPQATAALPQGAFPITLPLDDSIVSGENTEVADWDVPPPPVWGGTTFRQPPNAFARDAESTAATLRVDWDVSDQLTFTSLTGYIEYEQEDVYENDGTPFEVFMQVQLAEIESFSQELRLTGDSDWGNYTLGVYYANDTNNERQHAWSAENSLLQGFRFLASQAVGPESEAAFGFRNWENFLDVENTSWSVFGQTEIDINDTLTLTAGLRYTEDEADFSGCTRDNNGDGNIHALWNPLLAFGFFGITDFAAPGECVTFLSDYSGLTKDPVADTLEEDNVSGRLGLDWRLSDDSLVYLTLSRGFKSGNAYLGAGNVASQYAPVTQESVWAYEAGAKWTLSDSVQLNAAAYFYDYTDKQIFGRTLDPVFSTLPTLVNAPESSIWGIEADLKWDITPNFLVSLAANYMETEFDEFDAVQPDGSILDLAGESFSYAPELQISGLVSYFVPVADNLNLQATVDFSYTDEQYGDLGGNDPLFSIDSYLLLGAHLRLAPEDESWEAALFSRNLTDEYYVVATHRVTDTFTRYTGMPRTWGVSVKFNF